MASRKGPRTKGLMIQGACYWVSIEDEFWQVLRLLGAGDKGGIEGLVVEAIEAYPQYNVSSAVRVWLFQRKVKSSQDVAQAFARIGDDLMELAGHPRMRTPPKGSKPH